MTLCILAGLVLLSAPCLSAPVLGPRVLVASGGDPDLAVEPGGAIHLAYVRNLTVYHRAVGAGGKLSAESMVGKGVDPALAVDGQGNVHVVMVGGYSAGTVRYSRRSGASFSAPKVLTNSASCRKPRIALDPQHRAVISFEDKAKTKRIHYLRVAGDGTVSQQTLVGDDNNGGLVVDPAGVVHFSWRSNFIYYNQSSGPGKAGTSVKISPSASDFSDLDLRASDGSIHVVGEVANAGGIFYICKTGGIWKPPVVLAQAQAAVSEPDDVNPAVVVGAMGRVYVTFNGKGHAPYFFVIDSKGAVAPVAALDPGGEASEGKYKNPNLARAVGAGAQAAWGTATQKVYLRSITVKSPPKDGGLRPDAPPTDRGSADARPVDFAPVDGNSHTVEAGGDGLVVGAAGCSCRQGEAPGGFSQPLWPALPLVLALLVLRRSRPRANLWYAQLRSKTSWR